jgi:hypothetical protein
LSEAGGGSSLHFCFVIGSSQVHIADRTSRLKCSAMMMMMISVLPSCRLAGEISGLRRNIMSPYSGLKCPYINKINKIRYTCPQLTPFMCSGGRSAEHPTA